MSDYILSFSAPEATLARAGGKGANLTELARAGFAVPPGFIVTTEAYRAFVDANHLQDRILALATRALPDDPPELEAGSVEIRRLFAEGLLPTEIAAGIVAAYHTLMGAGSPVAVRSSATTEDLPGLAFAGQQDTYLNVIGESALLNAVKGCWGSLWTSRAISYRARNNVASADISLAVVVQTMVLAEASGVIFTANPVTGRRDEMVIDASFGLGEAIVSGQVAPDHYLVRANDWRVAQRKLGSKEVAVVPKTNGGTEYIRRDGAAAQALPDAQIIELARTAQQVADHFGAPQDIEWAWGGGQLRLLQARPITSLYPLPANSRPEEGLRIYVNFNSIQGVTDPFTPLGIDALRLLFGGVRNLLHVHSSMQALLPDAGGRLFLDFTDLVRDRRLATLALSFLANTAPGARTILRRLLADGQIPPKRVLTPKRAATLCLALLPLLRRVLPAMLRPESVRPAAIARGDRYIAETRIHAQQARDLASLLQAMEDDLSHADSISFSVMPSALPAYAAIPLLDRWLGQWLGEAPGAALPLMRGLPGNSTIEMDLTLWAVAQEIRADGAALEVMRSGSVEDLATAYQQGTLPTTAQRAVTDFLAKYGMRGVVELDIGRPRWHDDPTPLLHTLQSYLDLVDPGLAPDGVYRRGVDQAEQLAQDYVARARKTRFGWLRSRLLRGTIRRMRVLGGLREIPLFYLVSVTGIYRRALLDYASGMVARGELETASDIFFIPLDDLQHFARDQKMALKEMAATNRAEYEHERTRRQMPHVLFSTGEAFYQGSGDSSAKGEELAGDAVSPGTVEGRARVILDPRNAHLESGEILVCRSTDPGWTPLFLTAGGLVMEIGGLITHGSIVAREYGIPAIVGVEEATTRIKTGQPVRVDGNTGRITLLE